MQLPVQRQDAGSDHSSLPSILVDTLPAMKIPRVVVVIPTTGTRFLSKCLESVQKQTLLGVIHLIVIDGPEHAEKVHAILEPFLNKMPLHVMVLPFNAGANGWNGHRIYASMVMLLDYDFIAYLDEDNHYDPDHLELMHNLVVQDNLDWAFSLRKTIDTDGKFLALDNCESLGNMSHTVLSWNDFLVDTSCYFLTQKVAQAISPYWMHKARNAEIEADRSVCRFLLNHPSFRGKGVPKHTVNYTVAQRSDSVQIDFFTKGNAVFHHDFAAKETVYIFLENEQTTQLFFVESWAKNGHLLSGLSCKYNLVNGYALKHRIPTGSTVLLVLKEDKPEAFQRPDLRKIVYDDAAACGVANTDVLTLFKVPTNPVGRGVVCFGETCAVAQKYMAKLTTTNDTTFALVDSRDLACDALMAGAIPLYYGDDLADIPKDIFIDLTHRRIKTSSALQKHLDKLSIDKIQQMRDKVLEKRQEVVLDILPLRFSVRFDELYHAKSSVL